MDKKLFAKVTDGHVFIVAEDAAKDKPAVVNDAVKKKKAEAADTNARLAALERKIERMSRGNDPDGMGDIVKSLNAIEDGGSGGITHHADPEPAPKF